MAKRKKYPKLPNGFGSIKYLGKNRTNPYAVHPPTTEFKENGSPITPKAIAYVDDWFKGFGILSLYNNGAYTPDQEPPELLSCSSTDEVIQSIVSEYNKAMRVKLKEPDLGKTFAEVFDDFYKYKFETDRSREYSTSAKRSTISAFNNCKDLHNEVFKDLRHDDLQKIIDNCSLKHSSLELIVSLYHQMYKYADIQELVEKDYSAHIKINIPDDDEHGVPFSDSELTRLWHNKENPVVEFILIMCYSGFRIEAYKKLEINLYEDYFKGGIKTRTSRNRMVPIHSAIKHIVKKRLAEMNNLLPGSTGVFRTAMYEALADLDIEKHTPHDCRHTFSRLCEKYNVNENDRKRMLGHSFQNDITNSVYGHRSLEDLKSEIEKIKVCC